MPRQLHPQFKNMKTKKSSEIHDFLQYKRAKLIAHQQALTLIAAGAHDTAVAQIQGTLQKTDLRLLKSDIERICEYYTLIDASSCVACEAMNDWRADMASEITRIPRLLELHRSLAPLVQASPVHPFDVTPEEILEELFRDAQCALFSVPDRSCDTVIHRLDAIRTSARNASLIWPMPIKANHESSPDGQRLSIASNVQHWRYCHLECSFVNGVDALVDAIQQKHICPIWVSATCQTQVQLMFKVAANDRAQWEQERRKIATQLAGLGGSYNLPDLEALVPIPGRHPSCELVYFDPSVLTPEKNG